MNAETIHACQAECSSTLDSTALTICHNRCIKAHKVFTQAAKRGKTRVAWLTTYAGGGDRSVGFNEHGELTALAFTTGNVHGTKPVPAPVRPLFGKVYADKGYLSEPLRKTLLQQGVELITKARKNMKPRPLTPVDKFFLQERTFIDEMGYLPLDEVGATVFFQLVTARYERGSILLTSNKSYGDWGGVFGDTVMATAVLDRLLHHATTVNIRGDSYRMKERRKAELLGTLESRANAVIKDAGHDLLTVEQAAHCLQMSASSIRS